MIPDCNLASRIPRKGLVRSPRHLPDSASANCKAERPSSVHLVIRKAGLVYTIGCKLQRFSSRFINKEYATQIEEGYTRRKRTHRREWLKPILYLFARRTWSRNNPPVLRRLWVVLDALILLCFTITYSMPQLCAGRSNIVYRFKTPATN